MKTRSAAPIFIVGNVHSGTTMIQNILKRNPAIYGGRGESRFFHHLPIIRKKYPNLQNSTVLRAYLTYVLKLFAVSYGRVNIDTSDGDSIGLDELEIPAQAIDILEARSGPNPEHTVMFGLAADYLTHISGKTRWVEKTPAHIFMIDQILRSFPDAQFVELVRDPRAILASKLARRSLEWKEKKSHRKNADLKGSYDPLWNTLSWCSAIRSGNAAKAKFPDNILRVKYELFVQKPEVEAARLCEFLDIAFDPDILNVSWTNNTTFTSGRRVGIGTGAIDGWRNRLPKDAVCLCQLLARKEMRQLGYAPIRLPRWTYIQLLPKVVESAIETARLFVRRWRLGGRALLANMLGNYVSRLRSLFDLGSGR